MNGKDSGTVSYQIITEGYRQVDFSDGEQQFLKITQMDSDKLTSLTSNDINFMSKKDISYLYFNKEKALTLAKSKVEARIAQENAKK